jgi:hypothetical protein
MPLAGCFWFGFKLPRSGLVQQRVTATFRQRDGKTLHVRKATVAEPKLKEIYNKLGLDPSPGGTKKLVC